jgi:hypothetical protein
MRKERMCVSRSRKDGNGCAAAASGASTNGTAAGTVGVQSSPLLQQAILLTIAFRSDGASKRADMLRGVAIGPQPFYLCTTVNLNFGCDSHAPHKDGIAYSTLGWSGRWHGKVVCAGYGLRQIRWFLVLVIRIVRIWCCVQVANVEFSNKPMKAKARVRTEIYVVIKARQ